MFKYVYFDEIGAVTSVQCMYEGDSDAWKY